MAQTRELKGLRKVLHRLDGGDELTDQARHVLVRTLYTQPTSMAVGAFNGAITSMAAAFLSGIQIMFMLATLLAVIATGRVALSISLPIKEDVENTKQLEVLYEIGAFSYSLVLSIIAAMTLVLGLPAELEVLMVANALGYGIGICARNAGRPIIAMGQLLLVAVPIMAACAYVGGLAMTLLAITIFLLLPAMASITSNLAQALREAIAAAQTSRELADRMQTLARTDVDTGLANRAGMNHALAECLEKAAKDMQIGVFWLDLDRFKEVNDLFGHHIGDRVLTEIAKRITASMPAHSTVARFGGDEFVMFCEIDSRITCERIAARIQAEITRPLRIDGERIEMHGSMGIATMPDDGTTADALLQASDLALYQAKTNGKNQTCFFTQSMTRDLLRRREIEEELRAALQRDELSIFFQPIVDLETGRIRTFEALVRWFHPEKGELKPDEFIPVAEECGAIVTLGNWITAQAAKAAVQWPDDVTLAVNLSPLQIKAPGAALGILTALKEARLDPRRLELEVTESLFLEDTHHVESFIEELSAVGVKFALDDFGTGYSSLSYINRWPFSKIKVDRSFVSGPEAGKKSDAIIRAVSQMASTLDMAIVAEGIETVEQVAWTRDAGCTLGQGYYFSRAVPDYLAAMLLSKEHEEGGLLAVGG
jgi:diguanylate cyclase (GGDEF)-like protein